ncbi:MAG: hypothetical protein VR72_11485 [Clostridiaceae bacterium BRH_c20a]|nr:MAG: hypothetical protein VR72_11485 [Clostridiaceae bacterium BRH_c20a]
MNLPNETVKWGLSVVTYETLAAIAAGIAFVALVLILMGIKENKIEELRFPWKVSWLFMTGILLAVPVILGLHLEQPLRSIFIFLRANPTSPMPYGVIILSLWLLTALYGIYLIKKNSLSEKNIKGLSILAAICGILFVTYLGFLLSVMNGIKLWYSPLKPVQYIVSIFGVGSAVIFIAYKLAEYRDAKTIGRLAFLMMLGVAANIIVKAVNLLHGIYYSNTPGFSSMGMGFTHIGLEWLLGLLLPVGLLSYGGGLKGKIPVLNLSAVLIIIGSFFEKYNLIIGGQLISRTGYILQPDKQHIWGTEAFQALGGIALAVFFLLMLFMIVPPKNYEDEYMGSVSGNSLNQ